MELTPMQRARIAMLADFARIKNLHEQMDCEGPTPRGDLITRADRIASPWERREYRERWNRLWSQDFDLHRAHCGPCEPDQLRELTDERDLLARRVAELSGENDELRVTLDEALDLVSARALDADRERLIPTAIVELRGHVCDHEERG